MECDYRTVALFPVPSRLDDRIRELCAKALTAKDPELQRILGELQDSLHEHSERLRRLAAEKLGKREP
jgi:hypothetical protein